MVSLIDATSIVHDSEVLDVAADIYHGTRPVRLHLTVRKFICRNAACVRRIFTERLPALVGVYAHKPRRLVAALQAIGLALGGQAGARLRPACGCRPARPPCSASYGGPRCRLTPTLQAVGVDEWAWRRGHRYGAILVNLANHRVVDLLPDRSAASVAAWLAQHPTITVISRDRSPLYADGIRRGAPEAVQVVDRFHLVAQPPRSRRSLLGHPTTRAAGGGRSHGPGPHVVGSPRPRRADV